MTSLVRVGRILEHASATAVERPSRLALLLFIACSFPYVSPVRTPFDTQPYALIIALLVVAQGATREKLLHVRGVLLWPYLLTLVALVSWLQHGSTLAGLRSVFGYLTIAVVGMAAYLSASNVSGRYLRLIVAAWLVVGSVQQFILPTFGAEIIARMSTSETRGVTALAAEPSFFAMICIFFLLYNDYFLAAGHYGRRHYLINLVMIASCLFLAGSALGFILFAGYLLAKVLATGSPGAALLGGVIVAGVLGSVTWLYSNVEALRTSRVGNLLSTANTSLDRVLYGDESVAQRIFAIKASHLSLFYGDGLGYGVGTWQTGIREILAEAGDQLSAFGISSTRLDRVMSGFGSAIYELGIVGLAVPAFLVSAAWVTSRRGRSIGIRRWGAATGVTLFLLMETAIPLAFPLFAYTLGLLWSAGGPNGRAEANTSEWEGSIRRDRNP